MRRAVGREPVENPSHDEVWATNREVHSTFCGVSHNPLLMEFLDVVWDRFERYRGILDPVVLDPEVDREHSLIVNAIVDGDPARAVEEMRKHSMHGRAAISAALAEAEQIGA
jgi:DNA-binding GntR family transcriptional regulator